MLEQGIVHGAEAVLGAPYVPELIGGGLAVFGLVYAARKAYNFALGN